ncbi:tetratricopeptide repeat protein [Sphingomonas tabacisoli]|uniref:Tetratricopeptide repeat protein n=1 Tax=Sphingomonas tabacisoli TaxID=2249466 RepID=A0ABW4I036_9SPHN
MRFSSCLAAGALLVPGAASASSMVIGTGLARMCYEAADTDRATAATLDVCTRALTDEPLMLDDQVATFVNRGIIRTRLNDWNGALADYNQAIKLNPATAEAYLNKGSLVLRQMHDWQQARSLFDAALQHRTSHPEIAYYGRAVSSELAGDYAGAMADYQKASELAPNWEQPKKELARFSVRKRG